MDREKLAELLASLGDSPDRVANTIADDGVTGTPGVARCCPVANWLKRHGVTNPLVGPHNIVVDCYHDGEPRNCVTVDLPSSVRRFVKLVDTSDRYSDLTEAVS
ncbi:MAG: hypothetical protein ACRDP6_47250 [Actinoallomurus sp.]